MDKSDGSNRLQLHNSILFGREVESAVLIKAYEGNRNAKSLGNEIGPHIILVDGESGMGKSSLIEETMNQYERNNPEEFVAGEYETYFCTGKFHQFKSTEPFSAVKQAFSELCDSILSTRSRQELCDDLTETLGAEGKILTEVVPGIATLIGDHKGEIVANTQGSVESFFRLKFLFKLFVRTLCKYHRFILFTDDLQWSDKSTIELIQTIICDNEAHQLLFVGTYRSDEVTKNHPLSEMMIEVEKHKTIQRVHVSNLDVDTVDQMISHLTSCDQDKTRALSEVVHRKTLGNPFMVREFLQLLENEKYIEYSWMDLQWNFDINKIAKDTLLPDSVVEVVALRIKRLPAQIQAILKLAACLWSHFHAPSLFSISSKLGGEFSGFQSEEDLVAALNFAVEESLLDGLKDSHYKFSHDRVQQGLHSLLGVGKERSLQHLRIGEVLWSMLKSEERKNWMLFIAADQLNLGLDCVADPGKRLEMAQLNLDTGREAKKMSAFIPASEYFNQGIRLLKDDSWDLHYQLTLQLHVEAAEVAMCIGDNESCSTYASAVVKNSRSLEDRIPVFMSLINSYGSQTEYKKAMDLSVDVLNDLGEPFPRKANMVQVLIQLFKTMRVIGKMKDDEIASLPRMIDEKKSAAMVILNKYSVHALLRQRSADMLLCLIRNVQLTLKYGLHSISPSAICAYGLVLGSLGKLDEGIRYGALAMTLLESLGAKEWEANCAQIYHIFLRHWKETYSECVSGLTKAYKTGMTSGDIEFAFYNGICAVSFFFLAGLNLEPCEADCRLYCEQMLVYSRENNYSVSCPTWQLLLNLLGRSSDPLMLTGKAMDEVSFVEKATAEKNIGALQTYWINKGQLCYYFGDMIEARRVLVEFGKTKGNMETHFFTTTYTFFMALVLLDLARTTKKRKHVTAAKKLIKTMQGWVKLGNSNLAHKLLLLTAECNALHEKNEKNIRRAFDAAIVAASRAGFIQDAALGNERAGLWLSSRSSEDNDYWARVYLERAFLLYSDWSAQGKARHLVKCHSRILKIDGSSSIEKTGGESISQHTGFSGPNSGTSGYERSSFRGSESSSLDISAKLSQSSTAFRGVQRFDPNVVRQHTNVAERSSFFNVAE